MPQDWQITFSPGQQQDNEGDAAVPVLKYDPNPAVGARQQSAWHGTFSLSQSGPGLLSDPSYRSVRSDEVVPTGAVLRQVPRSNVRGKVTKLKTRQVWEGTVTEISDNGFIAILADKTNPASPQERASFDFDLTEVSHDDRELVAPGSSFYWVIGTEESAAGQVTNVSRLQFRRLPVWTEQRLSRSADRAELIWRSLQD